MKNLPARPHLDHLKKQAKRLIEDVRHGEMPKAPKIERPMIAGSARLPQAG